MIARLFRFVFFNAGFHRPINHIFLTVPTLPYLCVKKVFVMKMDFEKAKESIFRMMDTLEWEGRDAFLQGLMDTWTASELALLIGEHLEELFDKADDELWWVLSGCLDKRQTLDAGFLLNPSEIPSGDTPLLVVCQDPTCVHQAVERVVTYLGDVNLTIERGTAIVRDTAYFGGAYGESKVEAYGRTEMHGFDKATLILHDLSIGEVHDEAVAYATDKSYVKAFDHAKAVASGEAQFYLVEGSPSLVASDSARGLVSLAIEEGTSISLSGDALLYSSIPEYRLSVERKDYQGTAIFDSPLGLGIQEKIIARDMEVWYPEERYVPRSVEALRDSLLAFRPGDLSLRGALERADSPQGLCEAMMPFFDQLILSGMDGKFLRQHFPESVLEDNLIHAYSRPVSSRDNLETPGVHRFFGTQLVYPDRCAGETRCFERTLTIQRGEAAEASLSGKATGIVMDHGRLFVEGDAVVYGMGEGTAVLDAYAEGFLHGSSKAKAFGHALVHGYNGSTVEAAGESRLNAMRGCRAIVSEKAVVLAYPGSTIDASGDAQVGYVSERNSPIASVSLSGNARKKDATTFESFIDFMRIFNEESTKGVRR